MKKIYYTLTISMMICNYNCQNKEPKKNNIQEQNIENKKSFSMTSTKNEYNILPILEEQLEAGYLEGDYQYKYLEALFYIEDTILINRGGYKTPSISEFENKLKTIFNVTIDKKDITNKLFYINSDNNIHCYVLNPVIVNTFDNMGMDDGYNYIYLSLSNRYITSLLWLPQIIDYTKTPNYKDVEIEKDRDDRYWKDIDFLPKERRFNQQLLISRNKYLFNDDKSQFIWLTHNDENFMESLVTIFGYTEDKKLLNWVLEKNYNTAEDFIKKYVFVKDCQGDLKVREGILKYIEENTNNEEINYAMKLIYLSNRRHWENFSDTEYTKILAYMANTFDPLAEKYNNVGLYSSAKWSILGGEHFTRNPENWETLINEFKKNNYYGLPNLKQAIKYAEEF